MVQKISHFMNKLREPIRLFGWLDGSLYFVGWVLAKLSLGHIFLFKYYFVAQPVSEHPMLARPSNDITIFDVPKLDPLVARFPRPAAVIEARYEQGARCFAAVKGEEFIGFAWIVFKRYDEDEVRCQFEPLPGDRAAWDFDIHVEPKYRVGRAFLRLWDAVHAFLRENHYQWTLSRISAFNPHSLASHARLGTVALGSAVFVRVGAAQLMFSAQAPYLHLSLSAASAPKLELRAPALIEPKKSLAK